jgi:CopG antitoxin of type II toxin-antitoxin system
MLWSTRSNTQETQSYENTKYKPIPKFREEKWEQALWESADSKDYMDWSKAKTVAFVSLKPSTETISIRLPRSC